jgi:hypothetical protein
VARGFSGLAKPALPQQRFTIGRALARIHVEHDDARLPPLAHRVDSPARQIGEGGEQAGVVALPGRRGTSNAMSMSVPIG